ncbi:MAG: diadenylate cyclase [Nitrososphaerota archaeon]|nr:diadenylate cyclase [Nitrososphaerota archaeon]
MTEKNYISRDRNQINWYLNIAKKLKGFSSTTHKIVYPDKIDPKIHDFIINESDKVLFTCFLQLKYAYYCYMIKGKSVDEFFFDNELNDDAELKKLYADVFNQWDEETVKKETQLLLLRYNQLGEYALNFYYNELYDLKILLNLLLYSEEQKILEKNFMGQHNKDLFWRVDYKKIHEFASRCTQLFVSLLINDTRDGDTYLQVFMRLLAEYFDAYLVDHVQVFLKSDGSEKIEYTLASDDTIIKAKSVAEIRQSESYIKGEGITGSLLLGGEKDVLHVGSNDLENDERQSEEHRQKHSDLYGFCIKNFWTFPYYDRKDKMIGAFRIVNKRVSASGEKTVWTYEERATLLHITRWFEMQWHNIREKIDSSDDDLRNKNYNRFYELLALKWDNKNFFGTILTHLKAIINKKIENKHMDACFVVYPKDEARDIVAGAQYITYPLQPRFYEGINAVPFSFNSENPRLVNTEALKDISLLYRIIHPFTAFCLFASDGTFYGVCGLRLNKKVVPYTDNICDVPEAQKAMIFLAQGKEKSIQLYLNRSLIADYYLTESDGDWRFRLLSKYEKVLVTTGITEETAKYVCELIFELSHKRIGSLLIFSDEPNFGLTNLDEHKKMPGNTIIKQQNNVVILGWASMDGAVLCTKSGQVKYVGIIIADGDKKADLTPHINMLINRDQKGSRHVTAASYSKLHKSACVVAISQNMGISIFYDGEVKVWNDLIRNDPDLPLIIQE